MQRAESSYLLLSLNYAPEVTGVAPYSTGLARGLARRRGKVRVTTTHPHYPDWRVRPGYGQWVSDERGEGVCVTRLRHYVPSRPTTLKRALSEATFGIRLALRPWGRPRAIVAVSPGLISSGLARMRSLVTHRRVPFVVWVQDLYSLGLSETGQSGRISARAIGGVEGWLLRSASKVVVIHDRFAERVHRDFRVPADRISVIRNWSHLDTEEETDGHATRSELGWSDQEIVVLHAGNMGVKQGLANVIDAAKIAQLTDPNLRFVFLGNGSERRSLEHAAADLNNVSFLDPVPEEELIHVLRSADVLLVNEKQGVSEMAVPSKLTSYFASRRPVLAATDPGGITAEEVRRAGAGVVVDSGDPEAIVVAARALGADRESASTFASNGWRFRQSHLLESSALDKFEDLLSEFC